MYVSKKRLKEMGYNEGIFATFVWPEINRLPYTEEELFDTKELQSVGVYQAVEAELDPASTYRAALGLYEKVRSLNGGLSPMMGKMYTITKRQIEDRVILPEDMEFIFKYSQRTALEAMLTLMGEPTMDGLKMAAEQINSITEAASGSNLN